MCGGDKTPPPSASGAGTTPPATPSTPCPKKRRVVKITAKVPTTQSARGTNAIAPPFTHHEFSSTANVKPLASNTPTVLLRNCHDIDLIAETDPPNQADVVWNVEPNPGPDPKPALTPAGIKAKLKTDASGGYSITASLDGTTVYWNLVLVEVSIDSSAIQRNSGNFADDSSATSVRARSGPKPFPIDTPANCAMYAQAQVKLSAGSQASLDTYCDKITVGMPQNLGAAGAANADSATCNYQGGAKERERINKVRGLTSPVKDPAVVVTDLGYPILDRGGPSGTRATGGDTIFLSKSRSIPTTGTSRKVETCDNPGVGFAAVHPISGKPAINITGQNQFVLYLVAYSDDAKYTYVAYGSAPWTADFSGTIAADASGKLTWTKGASAGSSGAGAEFTKIEHGKEAQDAGCEVRPPVFLDYIIDAR